MPKLTDKPHSLFITHGGLSFLKCLPRMLNKTDYHWLVFYDVECHTYKLSSCTVPLQDDNGEDVSVSALSSFASFDDLYDYMSSYADLIHCVAVDPNLDTVAGVRFSQLVHDIVIKTQCEEAIFFTEESLCIEDTQEYLSFRHVLKPPISLKHAQVTQRGELHQGIHLEPLIHPDTVHRVGIHLEPLIHPDTVHRVGIHLEPLVHPDKVYPVVIRKKSLADWEMVSEVGIHTTSVVQKARLKQGCCSFFSKLFCQTGQKQSSFRWYFWSEIPVTPTFMQDSVDGLEIVRGDTASIR